MRQILSTLCICASFLTTGHIASADGVHHYVFFNRDRERISEPSFLQTKAFEGAQIKYTWRQLEQGSDNYDFGPIQQDLAFLHAHDKKLFIQIQDASFDVSIVLVPRYLLTDPQYHGGADKQFDIKNDDEAHATPQGWVARRWDPAVRERFQKLLAALGKEFDGKIEGINLPETAVDFGMTGRLFPKDFTPEIYRDAIVSNMAAMKRAFPNSVTIQYANFMPGKTADEGQKFLRDVYRQAGELKVGMGGPDLLPYRPWQMRNSYPMLHEFDAPIPKGIAVQEGNYNQVNPKTGQPVTVPELVEFATQYLKVQYIFWCTQEPFYSRDLIPFLRK